MDRIVATVGGTPLTKLDLLRIVRPAEAARLLARSETSLWRDAKRGKIAWRRIGPAAVGVPLGELLRAYGLLPADAPTPPEAAR
jgi:hypothetical protein